MAAISRTQNGILESFGDGTWGGIGEVFSASLKPLADLLNNSIVGVAFYDRKLQCQALNRAFEAMDVAAVGKSIGKTIHRLFGRETKKVKVAFRRAFTKGNLLSNFELTARSAASAKPRRWLVNLYPIKDELGRVRLVAATFSELTEENSLECYLGRLIAKFQEELPAKASLLGDGLPELLARSLHFASCSIEILKNAMSQQCLTADTRVGAGLMPLALFLALTQGQAPSTPSASEQAGRGLDAAEHRGSAQGGEAPGEEPSPRESQVLHLLTQGKSNKEIGLALEISTRTVETYRARIMRKLNLHSTAELVRYAIRNKISEL